MAGNHCSGAWVVLKGYLTRLGRTGQPQRIHGSGNPGLAQGGTGDVLAGFLSGLLAQEALRLDPGKTLSYAIWEHGAAADRLERRCRNWTSEQLAREVGR
jgi:NAD(P)H-hydrate epimerase